MKIVGFTIIKNALRMDYPVVEAIQSVLPVVDEMLVLVGDSTDSTEELIRSIGSPKIRIEHSVWNPNLRSGGEVLAEETNKAFQLIDPSADWAFYIQADEVIHEKGYASILEACRRYQHDPRVEVLVFPYTHFYASFDYVGDSRRWYSLEGRIIKNDKSITSFRDAQGFRRNGKKLTGVLLKDAPLYHYGWVKTPEQMAVKFREAGRYWQTDEQLEQQELADLFDFLGDYDSVARFTGTHPAVMKDRVATKNWQVQLDTGRKKFGLKDQLLYWLEKQTGLRPFEFRNFKLIRP